MRSLAPLLVVALAVPALAGNVKKDLADVSSALQALDANKLQAALARVAGANDAAAAKGLLKVIKSGRQDRADLYWQIVGTLTGLSDPRALDEIGKHLTKNGSDPVSQDVLFSLQNNRSAALLEAVYERILKKRDHPLQRMAVDRIGEQERPEAVDLLLETLKREERRKTPTAKRVKAVLAALFGADRGDHADWSAWWERNRETAFAKSARKSTGTVKDELDAGRRGALTSSVRRGRVIVLTGMVKNFDRIELMLKRLEIQHEVLPKAEFMKDMDKALNGTAALILNCNWFHSVCRCKTCKPGVNPNSRLPTCTGCSKHELKNDKLTDAAIARIKTFVQRGGSVFTEDWGLTELTSRAWPERVTSGRVLKAQTVDYLPVPGQTGNALLRGVLSQPDKNSKSAVRQALKTSWKVDDKSPAIKIADAARVTILLASNALRSSASTSENAVAITFAPGEAGDGDEIKSAERGKRPRRSRKRRKKRGKATGPSGGVVLHVLSHFGKQGSKQDEFTLQNLLVNFLLEAWERFAAHKR